MAVLKLSLLSICLFVATTNGAKILEVETKTAEEIDAGMLWPSGKVRYFLWYRIKGLKLQRSAPTSEGAEVGEPK